MKTIRRERLTAETRALANTAGSGYLYCGRPSPFGNPFKVQGPSAKYIREACDRYADYFNAPKQEALREQFLAAARKQWRKGFGIVLLCYCRDIGDCHTDTLVHYLMVQSSKKAGR